MRAAVYTATIFSLAIIGGLLWLEWSLKRDARELENWWAARERERTRGER